MTKNKKIRRRNFLKSVLAASAAIPAISNARTESSAGILSEDQTEVNGIPYGMLGNIKVSRLILGSNVMGGGAHSRDLVYVRQLMKSYNTEERVLNVIKIAESVGINTILQGSTSLVRKYNAEFGGHMQQIRPLQINKDDNEETIKKKLDKFAREKSPLIYVFGDSGDLLVRDGRVDIIEKALDLSKAAGLICGIGGHSLRVVVECEKNGLQPAFYVKTFHHDKYWSATPKENRKDYCWYAETGGNSYSGVKEDHNEFHDNIWCLEPEETIEVIKKVKVPFIAYKVLAAGAISPTSGFKFALQNGADFMAVGMLDFQIEEDAAIVKGLFARGVKRDRPWLG